MWIRTTKRRSDGTPLAREYNPPESAEPIEWSKNGYAQVSDELGDILIGRDHNGVERHDPDDSDDELDADENKTVEKARESPETADGSHGSDDTPDTATDDDAASGDAEPDATDAAEDEAESGEVVAEESVVIDTSEDGDDSADENETNSGTEAEADAETEQEER